MIDRITAHNLWVSLAFPDNEHMSAPLLNRLVFAALRGVGRDRDRVSTAFGFLL